MRKFWSDKEIAIIEKHYPLYTKEEMMKLLPDRSAISIGHKAARLGIRNEARPWTENELDILRSGYPCLSKEELMKTLPKKRWTSIRHKAQELGLKYDKEKFYKRNWKFYNDNEFILSDVDKGYLAGVLDADGSISIKKSIHTKGRIYYAPLIAYYNTDAKLMSRIRDIIGIGSLSDDHSAKSRNPKYKIKYTYTIGSIYGVKRILEQIVSLLTVKKIRAELVLELIKIKESRKGGIPNPRMIEIVAEVRRINKSRGKTNQY